MITSRITSKSQTTIPKSVRAALGVKEGDVLAYRIEDEQVVITRMNQDETEHDPFAAFDEWNSDADREAYANL